MLKKIFRKRYRQLLTQLTTKILEKHKPTIIVVTGNGQTSFAREAVYSVINTTYPVRRNIESPESEFSVPLTILGYPSYPSSYLDWLIFTTKILYGMKKITPHKHFLVLEINSADETIADYWMRTIKPETFLIVGSIPLDYSNYDIKKLVKIHSAASDDILGPYKLAARQIGRFYRIDDQKIEYALEKMALPNAKIRLFPGVNGSIIFDATHFYDAPSIQAVFDMIDPSSNERVVLFTKLKSDISALKHGNKKTILLNPKKYTPKNNDNVILRGYRPQSIQKFDYLFAEKSPIV